MAMTNLPVEERPPERPRRADPRLERLTAIVLMAVLASLGWMTLVSYLPDLARLPSLEAEVIAVLILLTAALGLVSVVALLDTRK
jgi:hypothetical protein